MSTLVTLQRQPDGSYTTSDGRWKLTLDYDHDAVTRGRGPRIWWYVDITGHTLPGTVRTLRKFRETYLN